MIRAENLRMEFDRTVAVDDLSLSIGRGEVFGLIGPNGAGKTTTIRMLATLLAPTRGTLNIAGKNPARRLYEVRAAIGYVPDFYGMPAGLTAFEYLEYFGRAYGMHSTKRAKRIDEVLDLVQLEQRRDRFIGTLSRGMKQRLCMAKALLHDPEVLLLDEPTGGLDPESRIDLKKILFQLQKTGKTVLISSHLLVDLAGFCTSLGIMEDGRLLESGRVEDLKRRYQDYRTIRMVVMLGVEAMERILRQDPGVLNVEINGKDVSIRYRGTLEALADLNAKLNGAGVRLASFHEAGDEIEEIFIRVTETMGTGKN